MSTYYVSEAQLGDEATEQDARRMVEILAAKGYDVEYGDCLGQDETDIANRDWEDGLDTISYQKALPELAQKFGIVAYEGVEYTLAQEAEYSNRLFPGGWGDAQEDEPYLAEFSAKAYDAQGNEVWIYWQFDTIKGREPADLGNYPWDNEHIMRIIPQ